VSNIPNGIVETGLIIYDGARLIGGKMPTMAANLAFGTEVWEPNLYSGYARGLAEAQVRGQGQAYAIDATLNYGTLGIWGTAKEGYYAAAYAIETGDTTALEFWLGRALTQGALLYFGLRGGTVKGPAGEACEPVVKAAQDAPAAMEAGPAAVEDGAAAAPQARAGVQPYEVDTYGNLIARRVKGDGLAMDHQPSNASNMARAEAQLGRRLTPAERVAIRDQGPAVAVPEELHRS